MKIVVWDNNDAFAEGPVWHFTTMKKQNNPPYIPSDFNPHDEKTNVDIITVLSWSGGDPDLQDVVTYNIYFGTTNPPPLIKTTHNSTSYNLGNLNYETMYFWNIVAFDNHGEMISGPINFKH